MPKTASSDSDPPLIAIEGTTAQDLGLKPGDTADPRYRSAYQQRPILRGPMTLVLEEAQRTDLASQDPKLFFIRMAPGLRPRHHLDIFVRVNEANGLARYPQWEREGGPYVIWTNEALIRRMCRLGFHVTPFPLDDNLSQPNAVPR